VGINRPAEPPPRPAAEPLTAQCRASNTGVIMIAGQKIALGRIHAGHAVTGRVAEHAITFELGGDDIRTVRRTTTQAVRSIKAHRSRKPSPENSCWCWAERRGKHGKCS
jgi:hypothetical protein